MDLNSAVRAVHTIRSRRALTFGVTPHDHDLVVIEAGEYDLEGVVLRGTLRGVEPTQSERLTDHDHAE